MSSSVGVGSAGGGGTDIASLLEKAKELDQLKKDQDDIVVEINKIHKKVLASPEMVDKSVDAILLKLRGLYARAKELSENEISASNALIGLLDGLLQSGASTAQKKKIEVGEQKKKRIKSDTDSARFSAASMRNQLDQAASLKGEQVAARVKSDDEKDEWFVVKVIHFDKETKEYEVLDEEPGDDEESTQKKYKLPMSYIIPFPKKGDPSSAPDFGQGRQVLAVYPGTTALYRATVASHRKRKSDDYILEFDDDEEDGSLPQRAVPFYRVVALPEGHRQ
ncbi:SAGA-associated factor 29 isoform X5 [Sorghum bicolor]|uniref:SAGA-associated factor 29 isoform X5 n=1 Tax=Sorghum bicolor TaxID=4558 RepID=UPI00081AB5F6|nr:SAGA-associated factor 29 isoform X5 [Sorghum bicolor]|eukprot:XP_021321857.1 SAGA-associated factor 29 isoform X5 [Sorghum bicolor]